MRRIKLMVTAVLISMPFMVNADPIFSGFYTNDGETITPTDDVVIFVSITNSGDMDGSFSNASFNFGNWGSAYGTASVIDWSFGNEFSGSWAPGETRVIEFFRIFGSPDIPLGDYFSNSGSVGRDSDGNLIQFGVFNWTVAASVPEPATLILLGIGLAGMGIARRKRKV